MKKSKAKKAAKPSSDPNKTYDKANASIAKKRKGKKPSYGGGGY